MNLIKQVEDAQGNQQHFEYDIVGRSKTTYLIPNGGTRQNDYTETSDQWGQIISRMAYPEGYEDPDVVEETYEYDLAGNMISRIDPEEHSTHYEYDPLNRLISITNALNETTDYEYDRLGGLNSQTQYEGGTEFVNGKGYDERGLLTSKSDPLGFTYSCQYNPRGLMSQQEDPEEQSFAYQYYNDSQLSQASVNNKSINYYYHPLGGIERYTVTGGGNGIDYSYSSIGLTVARTVNALPVTFDYDLNGNCVNMTGPFGLSLDYEIDSLNRPESITAGAKTFAYEYNGDGTIKKLTYANGITTDYSYDNARRLIKIENQHGSTILSSFSYEYDKNGNITSVTDEVTSTITSYEYDDINRLVRTTRPDSSQINYTYDSRGNRTEMTGSTITHEDFNPGTFTYNEWGEAEGYTTPEGVTASYEYDAEGLRTKKTTPDGSTRYYCDNAGRVIAEADGSNQVTAEIIWGNKPLARKIGSNYYYYLYNGHGDVIALTDESGNIVNSYDYDEWGNLISETEQISNPIRYAGEYYDPESGLYYLRARYYDPVLGRFISKDSVEGDITNPLSLNLYTYCHNDPLNYWDPSGHWEAGDENLPIWAQTAILVYTGQYMNATDQAGRDRAHANAQAVRYLIHSGLYQSREDWGAKPSKRVLDPSNNYFDTIVFHHTERPQYESMNELQYSALSSRKFDDIGYHFVIGADGTIYEGRSMENKGAHVELSNTGKIGIALMGNFESEDSMLNSIKNTIQGARPSEPTVAQIESAERITKILNDAYNIQTIGGHGSFWNQTLCPGNKGSEMLKFLYKNLQ